MVMQTAFLLQHLEKQRIWMLREKNITCATRVGQSAVAQQWWCAISLTQRDKSSLYQLWAPHLLLGNQCSDLLHGVQRVDKTDSLTNRKTNSFLWWEKTISFTTFVLFLTVMGLNPDKNTWLNQGMVVDSINLSDWSQRGRGPSWSPNQNSKKRKSSPPHLPLVGGRVKGSLVFRV